MIILAWRRIILGFRWPTAIFSLAIATVAYYALARWLQDNVLPVDLTATEHALGPAGGITPEPYELPLYLFGYVAIPVLAYPVYWLLERHWLAARTWWRGKSHWIWVAAVILGVIGLGLNWRPFVTDVTTIGAAASNYLGRVGIGHAAWLLLTKRLYAVRLTLGLSALFFLWLHWRGRPADFSWLRARLNPRWLSRLTWLLPVVLAVALFDPTFPYDRGHYNFVLGSINDVLAGKPFLYETTNQYGTLNLYLMLAWFRWVAPMSYAALSAVIMASYFVFFIALYAFVRRWLGSRAVALITTLASLATYVYLQSGGDRTAYHFPGTTPYRHGWYVIIAASLLWLSRANRHQLPWWRRDLPLQLAALGVAWNFDAGAAALAALLISLTIVEGTRGGQLPSNRIARVGGLWGRQFGYLAVVFGAIQLVNFIVYGRWPEWGATLGAVGVYVTGAARVPMPAVGMFAGYVLVYLVALLVVLRRLLWQQYLDPLFTYVVGYAVFVFAYFVGTSAWSYLYPVSVPLVLVATYLFWDNYLRPGIQRGPAEKFAAHVFATLLVFVALVVAIRLPFEFVKRDYRHMAYQFSPAANASSPAILADARHIAREFPPGTRVALAHRDDSELLLFAGRANYFPIYIYELIRSDWQLEELLELVRQQPPERLLIGDDDFLFRARFIEAVASAYERAEQWRTLTVYRRKNQP